MNEKERRVVEVLARKFEEEVEECVAFGRRVGLAAARVERQGAVAAAGRPRARRGGAPEKSGAAQSHRGGGRGVVVNGRLVRALGSRAVGSRRSDGRPRRRDGRFRPGRRPVGRRGRVAGRLGEGEHRRGGRGQWSAGQACDQSARPAVERQLVYACDGLQDAHRGGGTLLDGQAETEHQLILEIFGQTLDDGEHEDLSFELKGDDLALECDVGRDEPGGLERDLQIPGGSGGKAHVFRDDAYERGFVDVRDFQQVGGEVAAVRALAARAPLPPDASSRPRAEQ